MRFTAGRLHAVFSYSLNSSKLVSKLKIMYSQVLNIIINRTMCSAPNSIILLTKYLEKYKHKDNYYCKA
jgi:hypothetical protein